MPHGARTSPGHTNGDNGEAFHSVDGATRKVQRTTRKEKRGYYMISYPKRKENGGHEVVQGREP